MNPCTLSMVPCTGFSMDLDEKVGYVDKNEAEPSRAWTLGLKHNPLAVLDLTCSWETPSMFSMLTDS